MVRPSALLLSSLLTSLACDVREAPIPPPTPQTTTTTTAPSRTLAPRTRVALLDDPKPAPRGPTLAWSARTAIAVAELQSREPNLYKQLATLRPDRRVGDELFFSQPVLADPRAAPVLLQRLLNGHDPVTVRLAVVDALPNTGGDWQEGAAALIGIDASPTVRKRLVEIMRYADAPHSVNGLRLGFKDEDPEVNIAAARTAGFSRHGPDLAPELYSSTFDTDWDLRAAAVQSLGMLRLPQSREVLLKALYDEEREVRLQGLLALEQLDPEGVLWLPEIDRLARDRKSHRIARKADLMLQKRRAAQKAGKPDPLLAPAARAPTTPAIVSTGTH